jgi:simple sugar transport system permease protein
VIELVLVPFLEAMIRTATPLAFAALGELVTERAGVINIGLEGTIVAGCLGAFLVAGSSGVGAGFAAGAVAGLLMAAVFAFFVVTLRTDQIITGTALTLLGLGITGTWYSALQDGGSTIGAATISVRAIPWLSDLPLIGRALFRQPIPTYALYALVPVLAWWLTHTHGGLALRATGEHAEAARAAGVRTDRVRWLAIAFGGIMGGLCGATLVLAQVGTFTEGMSAGRGFIAIAIVVLGRWTPFGTAGAALVFGAAFALQFAFQSLGWDLPYQVFLALPYVLTLLLLATLRGRAAAPAELGR